MDKETMRLFNSYAAIHKLIAEEHSENELSVAIDEFLSLTDEGGNNHDEKYLIMSVLEYLRKEAPDDEQNLFMLADMLGAAIKKEGQEEYKSDLERLLFDLLAEKDTNHISIKYYKDFYKVAGEKNAYNIVKRCRKRFIIPGCNDQDNLFQYIKDVSDIEIFSKLVMLTFGINDDTEVANTNRLTQYLSVLYEKNSNQNRAVSINEIDVDLFEINELKIFFTNEQVERLYDFSEAIPLLNKGEKSAGIQLIIKITDWDFKFAKEWVNAFGTRPCTQARYEKLVAKLKYEPDDNSNQNMSNNKSQVPKLPIAFIIIATLIALAAPFLILQIIKPKIQASVQEAINKIPKMQTFSASNFSVFGKAVNDGNWVGNIDRNSGFRFTVNSEKQGAAKLSIKYKSDKRGGILKVNNETQYLYFPSTNWNWVNKDVIVQMKQGENNMDFGGGWLTDYAPDIAEIKIISDNNIKQDAIAGTWKGTYTENGTSGNGKLTLTINDDMTGIFETSITNRKSYVKSIKATFTVSVTNYNGNYRVTGKDWISSQPSNYGFDELNGTVSGDIFRGANFYLKKMTTAPTQSSNNAEQNGSNTEIEKNTTTTNSDRQPIDYTTKVESAVSNAINACENGDWDEAYKYYNEAASYPTDRSSSIKQTAAQKFLTKAKTIISNNNGECDDFSKKLLQNANSLYPSSEIRDFLNKCGGSTSSAVPSGSGRFPQGSQRLLSYSDLSGLSKSDLKIMRNEIFARHGYIFTTNDMKNYFKNQSWYIPRYNNVTSMLTGIEKNNIALIKQYE